MNEHGYFIFALAASLLVVVVTVGSAADATGTLRAKGTFDVKMAPTDHAPDPSIASFSLDKTYHGDLEATAKGEMMAVGGPATGRGGYVAMERVTGKLNGKSGSFAIMQSGTMKPGTAPQMVVSIVPGSGTDGLTNISGAMTITITGRQHEYVLDYSMDSH